MLPPTKLISLQTRSLSDRISKSFWPFLQLMTTFTNQMLPIKQRGIVSSTFKTKMIVADPRDETKRAIATQMAVNPSTLLINKAPFSSTLPFNQAYY